MRAERYRRNEKLGRERHAEVALSIASRRWSPARTHDIRRGAGLSEQAGADRGAVPGRRLQRQVGRIIAAELSERLGKQFIVDNRGGAGGIIGAEIVANAPKDGHTLLIVSLATAVNPWLYKLPFEPVKAFAPVVDHRHRAERGRGLSGAARAVDQGADRARQGSSRATFNTRSSGIGTFMHLGGELFKMTAGIDMLHVPFKGTAPAMIDLIGGNTKVTFGSTASTMPHHAQRQGPCARASAARAQSRAARRADRRRGRRARLRGGELDRPGRARGHAARDRGAAAQGDRRNPELAEGAEAVRRRGRRDRAHERRPSSAPSMASELAKWGKVVKEAGIKAQ